MWGWEGARASLCQSGGWMCVGVQQQPPPVNPLDRGGLGVNPAERGCHNANIR
jgi:hypothetical protein